MVFDPYEPLPCGACDCEYCEYCSALKNEIKKRKVEHDEVIKQESERKAETLKQISDIKALKEDNLRLKIILSSVIQQLNSKGLGIKI